MTTFVTIPQAIGLEWTITQKLARHDGAVRWRGSLQQFGPPGTIVYALTATEGQIIAYSAETNGSLQAFNRETGQRLWVNSLGGCSDGAGWAHDLEVGVGKVNVSSSSGGCIFAVDVATGQATWVVETRDGPDGAISIGGKPLYHSGVLYTSVERLWALDATTGKVLSFASELAYNTTGTILHHANGEILVWGDELTAYKPVR